jgi:3-hydroxyacyl-CoA dehydrogenase / 3-hydroxy-2-methylbutyryl-CoA dehydrogenase
VADVAVGSTAAVFGGASGLGAAAVRALHSTGWHVRVIDRDLPAASELCNELGPGTHALEADITSDEQVGAAFDATIAPSPRVVVCCAGVGWAERLVGRRGIHETGSFDTVVDVNLRGTFHVLRHAARVLATNEASGSGERGVCVLTSSIAAEDGQAGQVAYAATKAAIAGLTLPAARDLAPLGIRVCTIAPGMFDTPLLATLPHAARAELERQVPWPPRLGQPQEYASLVVEIVRNHMLNGAVLRLDGALRMPFSPATRNEEVDSHLDAH